MRFPIFIRNLSLLLLVLISGGGLLLFDVPVGIKIESKKKGTGK
jgi:glycerate-2-kinase